MTTRAQFLKSDLKLTGVEQVLVKMLSVSKAAEGRAARRAIRAASRVVVVAARARVPVDTGLLKKSLGVRIKTYRRTGVTVGVVGPRRGFRKLMRVSKTGKLIYRNPVHYAHLVERGFILRRFKKGPAIKHIEPNPFLRPALEENRSAIQSAMSAAIKKELGI